MILFAIVGVGVAELFEWRGRKVGEIGELLIGLALLLVIGGLLEVLFTDNSRTITGPVLGHIRIAGLSISGAQIVAVAFTLATSLGLYVFLRVSRWGRALRAVADNGEAAGLYGVRVPIARRAAVTISIVVAGAAGLVISPFTVLTPDVGSTYLISRVRRGDRRRDRQRAGRRPGRHRHRRRDLAVAGYLASYWTSLAPLIVILAVLLLRPQLSEAV